MPKVRKPKTDKRADQTFECTERELAIALNAVSRAIDTAEGACTNWEDLCSVGRRQLYSHHAKRIAKFVRLLRAAS